MASVQSIVRVVLLCLVALLASCNAKEQPPILPDRRQWVAYYVTTTAPDLFLGAQRVKSPSHLSNSNPDLSLWRHAYHDDFESYQVSTCPYIFLDSSAQVALDKAKRRGKKSYIYSVHLDERSINVKESFGDFGKHFEERWAILGDLLFRQVEGWRIVENGTYSPLVDNPAFDWQYYFGNTAYGGAPQLAGFPMNHSALQQEPWNKVICLFHSTESPQQQTCQPDESYAIEFNELPQGILFRLRDGRLDAKDCPGLLSFFYFTLPELKKRVSIYTNDNACQQVQNMISILSCPRVKNFNVTLHIGDMSFAGTYDSIKLTVEGEHGDSDTVSVGSGFGASWVSTRTLDLKEGFGSEAVALEEIRYLKIIDKWENTLGGDAWYCKGIFMRAECAGMNRFLVVNKLSRLEKWYQHNGDQVTDEVEKFWLYPRDWTPGFERRNQALFSMRHRGTRTDPKLVEPGVRFVGPIRVFQVECWNNLHNLRGCLKRHWTRIEADAF
ncbi:putative enterotoxin [Ophiocordyceps australis]|uniref:Putative enterotoxin n=1 Tax=Ophiocordyceps australis TaxID=1399860 RepID=A0A2C5XH02_9HYPO|nr:putative enterotoxin [Ophiocordyceps australis]